MKYRITLASIDRMQAAADSAARLHQVGLILFVCACLCISARTELPVWMSTVGLVATLLAFFVKGVGTLREIWLAKLLGKIMGMPYRRKVHGCDVSAWASIRSYIVVSVVLTAVAALTPSMLAAAGANALVNMTVAISMAALAIQSFDNPKRMQSRVMQICSGRMDLHANEGESLIA